MRDDTFALILDAADSTPWTPTEQGLWCPNCGDIIAPDFFFERDPDFEPPETCRQCGFPEFGA